MTSLTSLLVPSTFRLQRPRAAQAVRSDQFYFSAIDADEVAETPILK